MQLVEHTRTLKAHRRTTAIVICSRREAVVVEHISDSGVVVPSHQHDALRVFGIAAAQNRVDVSDHRGRGYALAYRLREAVRFHFEASAAILRVALEFTFNPLARGADSAAGFDRVRILRRKRATRLKADELLDVGLNLSC